MRSQQYHRNFLVIRPKLCLYIYKMYKNFFSKLSIHLLVLTKKKGYARCFTFHIFQISTYYCSIQHSRTVKVNYL